MWAAFCDEKISFEASFIHFFIVFLHYRLAKKLPDAFSNPKA